MINPDDLVNAALIEDEEDKRLREEAEKANPETPEVKPSEEAETPEKPNPVFSEEAEDDEEDEEQGEEQPKAEPKKVEAEEEPTSEEPKPTRKERREAKKQAWLESVRKEQRQQEQESRSQSQPQYQPNPQQPNYQPIDYRTVEEINEAELEQDRQTYGEISRRQGVTEGMRQAAFVAEQEKFWSDVEHEAKILGYDPEFKFLDETNSDTFNPDLAADLNEKYLEFVGYNPNNRTVRRTDISYERFVRKEMADRKSYAEQLAAENEATLAETKANAGLRPGGTSRKSGIGTLKPGDISKMTDEQLEKYEDEIDRQILSAWQ